ncbi:ParB family protein [Microbacterium arborescens]
MARAKLSSLVGRVDGAQAAEGAAGAIRACPAAGRKSDDRAAGGRSCKANKIPAKVSFYQDRDKTDRIRGAILHTMTSEGVRSLSQFLDAAAMKAVERLEAKHNNGKPFPPVAARELPQGRPMGE